MSRIVLIKSCQRFIHRRKACIDTWGTSLEKAGIPVFTVIGGFCEGGAGLFRDLIKTETGDDYHDNSIKVKQALQFLLQFHQFDFIFIIDDDSYVHPKRWLEHNPDGEMEGRLFFPETGKQRKMLRGKPWINGGPGWWMSRRICEQYAARQHRRCSWDDLLASQIAYDMRVRIVHRPDLYGDDVYAKQQEKVSKENRLITCHQIRPGEMYILHERLK